MVHYKIMYLKYISHKNQCGKNVVSKTLINYSKIITKECIGLIDVIIKNKIILVVLKNLIKKIKIIGLNYKEVISTPNDQVCKKGLNSETVLKNSKIKRILETKKIDEIIDLEKFFRSSGLSIKKPKRAVKIETKIKKIFIILILFNKNFFKSKKTFLFLIKLLK